MTIRSAKMSPCRRGQERFFYDLIDGCNDVGLIRLGGRQAKSRCATEYQGNARGFVRTEEANGHQGSEWDWKSDCRNWNPQSAERPRAGE
jgi:hypothetical protein